MRSLSCARPTLAANTSKKRQVETELSSAIDPHSEMFDDDEDFATDIERTSTSYALLSALRDVLTTQWAENHSDMPVVRQARAAVARAERTGIV